MSDFFKQVGGNFIRSSGGLLAPHINVQFSGLTGVVAGGGTATLDLSIGSFLGVVASGDFTMDNPTTQRLPGAPSLGGGTGTPGRLLLVQITNSGGVAITITWGSEWHFNGAWPALNAGLTVTSAWLMQWNPAGLVKFMSLIGRDNNQA